MNHLIFGGDILDTTVLSLSFHAPSPPPPKKKANTLVYVKNELWIFKPRVLKIKNHFLGLDKI